MYLFLVVVLVDAHVCPRAKIPLVEFPAADPEQLAALAAPTPLDVDEQPEYVYLFLVVTLPVALHPNAKIPLVTFPAADPFLLALLALATPVAVETHVA